MSGLKGQGKIMWPFKKKRKIIGYMTTHPSIEWYRKLLDGEITREEYANLPEGSMDRIRTPIYEDEITGI